MAFDAGKLVAYALIVEHHHTAQLQFGPVVTDSSLIAGCVTAIRNYYNEKKFGQLTIQLGMSDGEVANRIQKQIAQECKVVLKKNNKEIYFSLRIDITRSLEEIELDVSESTLRAIKRTVRHKIYAQQLSSLEEANQLGVIHEFMYRRRKSRLPFRHPKQVFTKAYKYLQETGNGMMVGSFGRSGNLHGGIVIHFHGDTAYYRLGASKAYGKMPVLHPAFMEAIKISREKGFKIFDLGWYNPYIKENSSLGRISHFKKGFGGQMVAWAPRMEFRLNLWKRIVTGANRMLHSLFRN
jgi:hypothetical protein